MKVVVVLLTLFVPFYFLLGSSEKDSDQVTDPQLKILLSEIKKLGSQLKGIEERLSKIENKLGEDSKDEDLDNPLDDLGRPPFFRPSQTPSLVKKLNKIKLPDNPSKEQVEKYVDSILKLSVGSRSWGSADLQNRMLEKVGSKHSDVLLDRLNRGFGSFPNNSYIITALKSIASKDLKNKIIDLLPAYPDLIKVVHSKGWIKDSKDALVSELMNPTRTHISDEIVLAASTLSEDAKVLEALKTAFILGKSDVQTLYNSITLIDRDELDELVAKMWKKWKFKRRLFNDEGATKAASVAMAHGISSGLKEMFEGLENLQDWTFGQIKSTIHSKTPARGLTQAALKKWYEENSDRLQWNKNSRKWVLVD